MHNIKANFDKIFKIAKEILGGELNEKGNYLRKGQYQNFLILK